MAEKSSRDKPKKRFGRLIRSDRTRNVIYRVAGKLPPRARNGLLRSARKARDLITYEKPAKGTAVRGTGRPPPRSFRVSPPPPPLTTDWPEPPDTSEVPGKPVHSVLKVGGSPPKFDVELFEALQEEYRSKKIVKEAQGLDTTSRAERARRRMLNVHDSIGLDGKTVLEFGCGAGYEVWYLAHHVGATEAWGIDVIERAAWEQLRDDKVHLVCADITEKNPFEENFFDRIMSFSVFEHVGHPYKALQELYAILKPGGLAWISANLYRSSVASHLYRDIYFPYPHLLFSDDVFKEYFERKGERVRGAAWVNKLTWLQYERYIDTIGFNTKMLRFSERELDEEFYKRFEDVLGRYPKWDLTKDFFTVVLEKPR